MSHSSDGGMAIWSISSVDRTRMLLLFTFNFLRSRRSHSTAGSSLTLSFARICSLLKTISLTRLIAWPSSWCCLMLTVFNVCVDWWRTRSSCSSNKLLFVFTAQSHSSLQHPCVFIRSVIAKIPHLCRSCYNLQYLLENGLKRLRWYYSFQVCNEC